MENLQQNIGIIDIGNGHGDFEDYFNPRTVKAPLGFFNDGDAKNISLWNKYMHTAS